MKFQAILVLILAIVSAHGNPIAGPSVVMIAENVLISTSPDAIMVAGRYRFRATEDRVPNSDPRYLPFNASFALPIPVPESTKISEHLSADLAPTLTYQKQIFRGEIWSTFTDLPEIQSVKFVASHFFMQANSAEFEVEIRYQQPVIRRAGRLFAYYVPLLPGFESHKKRYNLREETFVVSFEGLLGSSIKLLTPYARVLQSTPKLVSIQALNREVLEVEIIPATSGSASH